jgi:putative hydrolase of the HAD superfamily
MIEDFDRFFEKVFDTFRGSQGWILFPETRDVLTHLKGRNLKLGVVSNFDTRIYSVMESLSIRQFFDAITTSSETGFCKPERQIFEAAVGALECNPSRVIMVGDSLRDDVQAAIHAGLYGILIDRTGRHTSSTVPRISSLQELIPLLISLP